jgi:hypothetical protein
MTAFQGCPVVHLELATGSFRSVLACRLNDEILPKD